jgi:ribonuclease J
VEVADELGLLDIPHDTQVSLGEARQLDDDQIVYLVTGSQGENRAALWQLATGAYKGMQIE